MTFSRTTVANGMSADRSENFIWVFWQVLQTNRTSVVLSWRTCERNAPKKPKVESFYKVIPNISIPKINASTRRVHLYGFEHVNPQKLREGQIRWHQFPVPLFQPQQFQRIRQKNIVCSLHSATPSQPETYLSQMSDCKTP